ncbi:hypothetical protein [Variovorax sp. dw_954]|uniref:hypothetical protein n=1 Tax=Variovorax sp. dw_954 TaxID=2720078 RepID=UPI001BD365CE|nr:hypothetical protein [Variovorax sp. dw_954]
MPQPLSDREAVAAVLVMMVRARLVATHAGKTLRTGLQSSVPVSERPAVRRGLDALLDHGILAMNGEFIGFSPKGRMYLAHVQLALGQAPSAYEHDDESPAVRAALIEAIEADERFEPYASMEEVQSLPARLESHGPKPKPKRKRKTRGSWLLPLALAAGAAAFYALRM